jgi:c-Rel proto-oncogene protein
VAIPFRTPRYKSTDITEPVRIKVQLRRPSDGATSEPLDFEMLPLNEGRRGFWNIQRELKKRSATTDLFQQLLEDHEDEKLKIQKEQLVNSQPLHVNHNVIVLDTPVEENAKPIVANSSEDKTLNWLENAEFVIDGNNNENNQNLMNQSEDEKVFNDLMSELEQVTELDIIYEDNQLRRDHMMLENDLKCLDQQLPKEENCMEVEIEDNFDDSATYTSLQKAFKHPLSITEGPPLPPKPGQIGDGTTFELFLPPIVVNPATPDILSIKREGFYEEKLPPLPPKRAKKAGDGDKENIVENTDESGLVRHNSTRSLTPKPPTQIVIKSADVRRSPSHKLPPKPTSTLPKQKKPGFFSKMFTRRKSRSDADSTNADSQSNGFVDAETVSMTNFSTNDANRGSIRSTNSLKPDAKKPKTSKPVARSVSSVSGKRPHLTPDVIHIPLKGDSSNSLPLRASESNGHLSLPGNEFYERASTASLSPIDRKTMSALQLADVPISDGNMELVAIADAQSLRNLCEGEYGITLDPSVDLTEAEHYALYTTLAPHATESEFDEASCYYQPIEAGQILTPEEVAKRLAENL